MGIAMRNTSYSPLFNEGLDFSCAIFDEQGEMIAQAEFCPAQLGAIIYVVEWTILEIGPENFRPGDVVFHNDPFRGGCHLPEYCVIKPVFVDGELVGFVACIGHMTEVGGKVPGGFAGDATEVFQEGIRIPPLKIVDGGRGRRSRLEHHPRERPHAANLIRRHEGDDRLALRRRATHRRARREATGSTQLREIKEAIKDYSERRMRAEIAEMPDGVYHFEDYRHRQRRHHRRARRS